MADKYPNGILMPEELVREIREKFYYVERCPMTNVERLFFDNSGGTFRLKAVSESFNSVDQLPNCTGHGGVVSDYLDSMRVKASQALRYMFNAEDGCIVTSMTASIIIWDAITAVIRSVPGTNVVTTELEHPSSYDACEVGCKTYGKELRVARTNKATGSIDPEDIVKLVDKDTCLLSIIMTSNISGAILDIETIVREARKIKPDVYVICDCVQHVPHGLVDMKQTAVDAVNFAAYKFGGMRGLGAGWLSKRLAELPHAKLIRERVDNWEMGGCAPGSYAQIIELFNYVCWIGSHFVDTEDKRAQYVEGMNRIAWHERALLKHMLDGPDELLGVRHIPGVHVISDNPDLTQRDLIVALTFDGKKCVDVSREYEKRGVIVNERVQESLYSARQVLSLGVPGIVRITPLHCHRIHEIDKFLKITAEIAAL